MIEGKEHAASQAKGDPESFSTLKQRESPSLVRLETAFYTEQALVFLYHSSDTSTLCTVLLTSPRARSELA